MILRAIFDKPKCLPASFTILHVISSNILSKPSKSVVGIAKFSELSISTYNSVFSDHLKNKKIGEDRAVFSRIPLTNVYFCTKMIARHIKDHRLDEALELFDKMAVKDVVTWNLMIKGCLDCGAMEIGLKIFDEMPERDVISWTTMVNGLLKAGRVNEGERLFWRMPVRDIAAWNAMIYGYFVNSRVEKAVKLFERMPSMNVISWTSMISGLDQCGRSHEALLMFDRMMHLGVLPTSSTLSSVISACANALELALGIQVHGHILKLGHFYDAYMSTSLITFYANCKQMDDSCKVFNEKLHMNVVVWTSLLTAYGSNSKHEEALEVFRDMVMSGIPPNQSSFTSALRSSSEMEVIDLGKVIHGATVKHGLDSDVFVGNSLVVLYSRCGQISYGIDIFRDITNKNIVSWNSIIVGCAQHGCGKWALTLFGQMVLAGNYPDDITFTGLLSACSHSGLLQKGRQFFDYLCKTKTLEVKLEHYSCMLDVLCRSGELDEAENLIKSMPFKPDLKMWLALLNGCRKHSNLEVAERVADQISNLDPQCSPAHVILSNMYAFAGRWTDVARIRVQMKRRGIIKQPGCSWVIQKGVQHIFVSGDISHHQNKQIYQKLEELGKKLKELGYVPDQRFALHDLEDEQKEAVLSRHSERLAICFALITSVEGSKITIMKNLRVCEDCHSAIKLIAKIVERQIIVRDSSRFHHFQDGLCSCKDYW